MERRTPKEIAEDFLARLSDPDRRSTVHELYSDDAVIRRPGSVFSGPDAVNEYLTSGEGRYEHVDKEISWWLESDCRVACGGTLFGTTADGMEFEGIRFMDSFEIVDGKITRHEIHNDIYVEGVL